MNRFYPVCILLFLYTFVFLPKVVPVFAQSELWYEDFNPLRVRYVSPTGNGNGLTINSPMSLKSAIDSSVAGDLNYLLAGTYSPNVSTPDWEGTMLITSTGTQENPVVYRAYPGDRVIIVGNVSIGSSELSEEKGRFNWVWGLEITDPDNAVPAGREKGSGLVMFAQGSRAINNIIHHQAGKNGIGSWGNPIDEQFPSGTIQGHVIYGNIIYENGINSTPDDCINAPSHNVYGHNSYADENNNIYGYRYFIDNVIVQSAPDCGRSKNFLMRSSSGEVSGFHLENNLIAEGGIAINGEGRPSYNMIFINNEFVDSYFLQGGRAFQGKIVSNMYINTLVEIQSLWAHDPLIPQTVDYTVFKDNTIFRDGYQYQLITVTSTDPALGVQPIRTHDVWNFNQYGPFATANTHFRATIRANNKIYASGNTSDMTAFVQGTEGIRYNSDEKIDENSTLIPKPTADHIFEIPNRYEPAVSYFAVYNWDSNNEFTVHLTEGNNVTKNIYEALNYSETPILTTTNSDFTIANPQNLTFQVYKVVYPDLNPSPTSGNQNNCNLNTQGDANCDMVVDLIDFNIWRGQYTGSSPGSQHDCDFNSDSAVDLIDFNIWRSTYTSAN